MNLGTPNMNILFLKNYFYWSKIVDMDTDYQIRSDADIGGIVSPGQPFGAGIYTIGNCPLHYHPDLELIWCVEGIVRVDTIYEKYHLQEGDFLLVDRNDFHNISGKIHTNRIIIAHISDEFINKICGNRFPYFICEWYGDSRGNEDKINLIKHLILQLIKQPENLAEKTETLIKIFLHHFNILYYLNSESDIPILQESRILEIINYMKHNHREKIRLSDISRTENIEFTYLSRLLKKVSSLTFNEHLEFLRTEAALNMCLKTTMPLNRIAYECGFSDIKYLYRGFKTWFDYTPGAIRKQYKLNEAGKFSVDKLNPDEVSKIIQELEKEDRNRSQAELPESKLYNRKYPEDLIEKVLDQYYSGAKISELISRHKLPKATVYNWIKKSKEDLKIDEHGYLRLQYENRRLKLEIEKLTKQLQEKHD